MNTTPQSPPQTLDPLATWSLHPYHWQSPFIHSTTNPHRHPTQCRPTRCKHCHQTILQNWNQTRPHPKTAIYINPHSLNATEEQQARNLGYQCVTLHPIHAYGQLTILHLKQRPPAPHPLKPPLAWMTVATIHACQTLPPPPTGTPITRPQPWKTPEMEGQLF